MGDEQTASEMADAATEIPKIDWKALAAATVVTPGKRVKLERDFDPSRGDDSIGKKAGRLALEDAKVKLAALQDRFAAQSDRSVLVVLQAIDAAGKDGTIKHVMSGLNPQGVTVWSFKGPSSLERQHDFLWRHAMVLPKFGEITVFNRSHYENVLVTRVHPELLWPKSPAEPPKRSIWKSRFRAINEWERHLHDNGTVVVKLFLHVSRAEQAARLLQRIDDPNKNWKFEPADMAERAYWDDYQNAFDDMLSNTSTDIAPWHVIPADRKWFSRLSTFAVLLETLRTIDPQYPDVDAETAAKFADARKVLVEELGADPADAEK